MVPQTVRSYHALSCLWCATCSVVIFGDVGRAMVGTACSSFAEAVREASTSPITGNHRYHPSQQGSKTSTWKYACLNKARIWLCQSKVGFLKMRGWSRNSEALDRKDARERQGVFDEHARHEDGHERLAQFLGSRQHSLGSRWKQPCPR